MQTIATIGLDEVSQDGGVIAGAGSDMHDVFACHRRRLVNEVRMQRRLPIVDFLFEQNANEIIGVEIDWIGVGRLDVPTPS